MILTIFMSFIKINENKWKNKKVKFEKDFFEHKLNFYHSVMKYIKTRQKKEKNCIKI